LGQIAGIQHQVVGDLLLAVKQRENRMKLSVRVPATTANLGPGFDCLGLALDLWATFWVESIQHGLEVECRCDDGTALPSDGQNLAVQAMRAAFRRANKPLPSLRIRVECGIPIGRGLGSSAAAIVGGLVAANSLLGGCYSQAELLALATSIEGHPDNVAAALLGGLVIAVQDGKRLTTVRRPVPRSLECVLFIPQHALSTKLARKVLPACVPRADAVYNIGRAALWIAAVQTRQWEWLDLATRDRLHQPYRRSLIKGMEQVFESARQAGARGVALSGAGPTLIAFTDRAGGAIAEAMERTGARLGLTGTARIVKVSRRGAYLTFPSGRENRFD
jgi:homoserine kinase